MFKHLLVSAALFVSGWAGAASIPSLKSPRALVLDAATGEVLLEKDAHQVASIASLTKLMTAMVVLDAQLNPFEVLQIEPEDLDSIKGTKSGVPVGSRFTRKTLIRLALLSSDNHAAAALARTYPGGREAFVRAVALKATALEMKDTFLEEPTGLSPRNRSSATDLAHMLAASSNYPDIAEITSQPSAQFEVNGVKTVFHNTNHMVGSPGWSVLVSKTGYTREAGRCLTMLLQEAERKVLVVLMGASNGGSRALDAMNIKRWLTGQPLLAKSTAVKADAGAAAVSPRQFGRHAQTVQAVIR